MSKKSRVKYRGFATLLKKDPKRMREIAANGGRSAWQKGKAHKWTAAEASVAGYKSGKLRRERSGVI